MRIFKIIAAILITILFSCTAMFENMGQTIGTAMAESMALAIYQPLMITMESQYIIAGIEATADGQTKDDFINKKVRNICIRLNESKYTPSRAIQAVFRGNDADSAWLEASKDSLEYLDKGSYILFENEDDTLRFDSLKIVSENLDYLFASDSMRHSKSFNKFCMSSGFDTTDILNGFPAKLSVSTYRTNDNNAEAAVLTYEQIDNEGNVSDVVKIELTQYEYGWKASKKQVEKGNYDIVSILPDSVGAKNLTYTSEYNEAKKKMIRAAIKRLVSQCLHPSEYYVAFEEGEKESVLHLWHQDMFGKEIVRTLGDPTGKCRDFIYSMREEEITEEKKWE
ncbi:MAG: hypothetical protein GF411_13045 [Candidatus Lokiarchaeota archaeon]|nr:hypothetical protein [Candidatus Lokiarchaeota archaeon]